MDIQRAIKYIFRILAYSVFIFTVIIIGYYSFNPHYFYVINQPDGYNDCDTLIGKSYLYCSNESRPLLVCDKNTGFKDRIYEDVIKVKIYYKECYMVNLPNDKPYIEKIGGIKTFVYKNQWLIIGIYAILYILKDIYDAYYKKKNYIYKLWQKLKY